MNDPRPVLQLGHSPDPDDAFMWWPLSPPEVGGPEEPLANTHFRYQPVLEDIETLNRRSDTGDLEITAISCAQFPHIADRYAVTTCGSSLGDQYGPILVSRESMQIADLTRTGVVIAIPGERTSAFAATSVLLGRNSFRHVVVPFDEIIPRVIDGTYPVGLVIHEGQVTFEEVGLHRIADVGTWWSSRCGLPLPLGLNTVRRDLDDLHGPGSTQQVVNDLYRSIKHALAHKNEALAYASRYGRDTTPEQTRAFVDMYVNRWSIDLGAIGRAAVETFLSEINRAGITPEAVVAFLEPSLE